MTSSQQHFPRPSHRGRDFDDPNLRYFLPSRYGTMDIDTDLTKTAAYSVDTATTTTTTTSSLPPQANSMNGGDTYSNGTALNSLPSYLDYPNRKPFVNSDYTPDTNKPVNSYPTTDRDAVLSALRNLQDKVKTLELERMAAEHNLESLASHTEQYKELLNSDRYSTSQKSKAPPPTSSSSQQQPTLFTRDHHYSSSHSNGRTYINTQAKELDGQLSSAENRCKSLEKQLDYMKKLVDNSENDRRQLVEKTLKARKDPDIRLHLDRLNELERDQLRLNATQSLAEAKIRELEDQMGEEKLYRRTMQGKTSQLETACRDKKPFPPSKTSSSTAPVKPAVPPTVSKTKKPPKKKKKKAPPPQTTRPASSHHCKSEPTRHYRLNLAEIPFVAGKSTTPSHALGANVQKVLAMMKSHNVALCSQVYAGSEGQRSESPASSGSGSSVASSSIDQDLTDLLNQLQEEFGQLSSDHQDLVQQLHGASDKGERLDLEQEIEVVVSRMEAKAQQIAKIRQHQNKYEEKKRTSSKSLKSKRPHSAGGRLITTNNHHNHHHHHHHPHRNAHAHQNGNTARPKGQTDGTTPSNMAQGKPALFMLRDMKKLQTTLRRDDLCWD